MAKSLRKLLAGMFMVTTMLPVSASAQVAIERARGSAFFRSDVVRPFDTDVWRVQTGRGFQVVVRAAETRRGISVQVFDASTGRFIGSESDDRHVVISGFAASGRIVVRVHNPGRRPVPYQIWVR